jgi:hypothetical protein
MKHTTVLLALATCLVGTGQIARAQTPPDSLRACARMQAASERLQCYDTQMAAMGVSVGCPPAAAAGSPAVVPPAPAAPTVPSPPTQPPAVTSATAPPLPPPAPSAEPAPSAAAKFGEDTLKKSKRPPVAESDRLLQSTIASIKEIRPKMFLIVLANGQIWLQEGTQITMFFHAGFDVRVEKGLLSGDYRMWTVQTGEKNWVRVSRIQ